MQQKIIDILIQSGDSGCYNSYTVSQKLNVSHEELVSCLKSLESRHYVKLTQHQTQKFVLSKEGENYKQNGSPEYLIYKHLIQQEGGQQIKSEVEKQFAEVFKVALSNGMKTLFQIQGENLAAIIKEENSSDKTQDLLIRISQIDFFNPETDNLVNDPNVQKLKKRKLVDLKQLVYYEFRKDEGLRDVFYEEKADLSYQDIQQNQHLNEEMFKQMNLESKGKVINSGSLHPLMKMWSEFWNILLEMGFSEMETCQYVESSFFNFDSLFQPQQHPAREAHDTFFLKEPEKCELRTQELKDYQEKIRQMHQTGYKGENGQSQGWNYTWSEKEASKNILRTHTTSVSARKLYEIGQIYQKTGVFTPSKCFSIDRVFRNETLDSTHLAEFHQVEGLIIGKGLGLPQLKYFIKTFFNKIGISDIKFKPAYNPYTEPSMEIFGYHPQLKRTIEIGNSGVFRPEMLIPMGLPEDCTVIAWGLSLERPAMMRYQCNNIRELFGYKADFNWIKQSEVISFL